MAPEERRLRILDLTQTIPYPPRSGIDLRVWNLCCGLSGLAEQTVLCRSFAPPDALQTAAFARHHIDLQCEPAPRPGILTKLGKALMFLPRPYALAMAGWHFAALHRRLQGILARDAFDIIVLEGVWLACYWPAVCRSAACRVFAAPDVESELWSAQAASRPVGLSRLIMQFDARRVRRLERAIQETADLVTATSEQDRAKLQASAPDTRVAAVRNGVDCDRLLPLPETGNREVLYVGSLQYHPNRDAVLYFVREVWPELRRRVPDAVFRVIGRQPPPQFKALLDGVSGVFVEGEVPEVGPHYRRSAVCVVPLRMGGGTRLKILEAFAYGRPVLATRKGAEGLLVENGRHLLIADDPVAMACALERLLKEPALRSRLAAAGRTLVEKEYAWPRIAGDLHRLYREVVDGAQRRPKHRRRRGWPNI